MPPSLTEREQNESAAVVKKRSLWRQVDGHHVRQGKRRLECEHNNGHQDLEHALSLTVRVSYSRAGEVCAR